MEKFAIIKIDGKQMKVSEGDTFKVNRQEKLDITVLAYSDGKVFAVGTPVLEDIVVKAKISGEERGRKIDVSRFRSKSRHRRNRTHRQPLSLVTIESINKKGTAATSQKKEEKEEKKPSPKRKSSTKSKAKAKKE